MNGCFAAMAGMAGRFGACRRGAVKLDFALIAVAMLIGIAVALDDIGATLMTGRVVASGLL